MTSGSDSRTRPLRPEDLELLDYIIASAIESCIEARRKSANERREQRTDQRR
jgi:hypothetical protein